MKDEEKIKEQFIKFNAKGLDELTAKEEDFLLELWGEQQKEKTEVENEHK